MQFHDRSTTKRTGNASEARVLSVFVLLGWEVLLPFGDCEPYDMVINRGNGFERIQVKTGCVRDGRVDFQTSGVVYKNNTMERFGKRNYRGKADLFAVYCEELDNVYLVSVDEVGVSGCSLRLDPTKNGQVKNVRMANDYLLRIT